MRVRSKQLVSPNQLLLIRSKQLWIKLLLGSEQLWIAASEKLLLLRCREDLLLVGSQQLLRVPSDQLEVV